MPDSSTNASGHVARLLLAHLLPDIEALDVMGPTIQFLVEDDNAPCVMRGTIPPGVVIPLHSHADPETFLQVSGEVEALMQTAESSDWVRIGPGDVFHVPGNVRHAFRNVARQPAVNIVMSTPTMGRFFREVGIPAAVRATRGPPSQEEVERFLAIARKYGYWNATPEENARVGIDLPQA
jgi:quercetin dioxygenase-like cupin family protein